MSFNANHPECRPDEVFITNITEDADYTSIKWDTKRAGKTAYTTAGRVLPDMRPVFVSRAEIQAQKDGRKMLRKIGEANWWTS